MRFTQFTPSSTPAIGVKRSRPASARATVAAANAALGLGAADNNDNDNGDDDERDGAAPPRQSRARLDRFSNQAPTSQTGVSSMGATLDDDADAAAAAAAAVAVGALLPAPTTTARIWGTNIDTQQVQDSFRHFLRTFCERDDTLAAAAVGAATRASTDVDESLSADAVHALARHTAAATAHGDGAESRPRVPLYPILLEHLARTQSSALNVNCAYLRRFDRLLYDQTIEYPTEMLGLFDIVVQEELRDLCAELGVDEPALRAKVIFVWFCCCCCCCCCFFFFKRDL